MANSTSREVGVYLIRNRRTGDTYVGASTQLDVRLRSQLSEILNRQDPNGARYGRRPPFNGAFCGCSEADVELRIID